MRSSELSFRSTPREMEMTYEEEDDMLEEGTPFTPTQFPSTAFDGSSSSHYFSSFFSSRKTKLLVVGLLIVLILLPFLVFSGNEDAALAQNEVEAQANSKAQESIHIDQSASSDSGVVPSAAFSPDQPPATSPSSDSDSSLPPAAVDESLGDSPSSYNEPTKPPSPTLNTAALEEPESGGLERTKTRGIAFKDTVETNIDSKLRGNVNSTLRPVRIGSVGLGHWGGTFLDVIFQLAYPGRAFLYTQESPTDVVVATHFYGWEPPLPQFEKVPYFSWSGESRLDSLYFYNRPPIFYLLSMVLPKELKNMEQFATSTEYLVPFVTHVTMDHTLHVDPVLLNRSLALGDQPRPYRLAYINANCEAHRERMFALMLEKCGTTSVKKTNVVGSSSHKLCHALGRCSNNFLMAEKTAERSKNETDAQRFQQKIVRKFDPDRAHFGANVALFKSYRFALVFEHANTAGFMTEKIIMAFKGGAIPIFWGSGSNPSYAKQWFNPLAYVDCGDFHTLRQCRDKVYQIDNNPNLLREMQQQPIFKDNTPPDLFKGIDSKFLREIAMNLRRHVPIQD